MPGMKPSIRFLLLLAAVLIVAAAVFRQEKEIYRLRGVIAELASVPKEAVTNPLLAEIEELRRDADEVHRLRDEVAHLRREQVETSALQAKIDNLALQMSAILRNFNQSTDSAAISGEFNHPALTQLSPEEAAQWVAGLPPGKEQDRAVLTVIGRWVDTDPVAAAAWTTQFAEGSLREQAMSVVARYWGLRDWNATAGWLGTLPMGASRDAAIGSFITSADGYDIKLALEWANQMEAPESRAMRVEETARRWLREDSAAARAWLRKAQLPSGIAERLLSAKSINDGLPRDE